jgi:hypothetical protein
MGGTAAKTLLALALAAVLAFGLAACGGGGDSSSSRATTSDSAQGTTTAPPRQSGDDAGANEKQSGDDKGGSAGGGDSSGGDDPNSEDRSAEFRTPGGDNSIQDFGEEAGGAELQAAEEVIVPYLEARENGEWAKSCTYLSKPTKEPIEQIESSPRLKGKGCGGVIATMSSGAPASLLESPVVEGIASLRAEGERGFALFHGPKGAGYFIGLVKEDGEWKIGTLIATELP